MTRFHATPQGNVPFTAEEEAARDTAEAEWLAGASERKAESIRRKRDELLSKCDWMAGSDVTMSDGWRAYRQALRDLPAQDGFPESVSWPAEPS